MMKAAILIKPKQFELKNCPIPTPGADEVLVKIHQTSICGTDVHIFHGHYASESLPMIPGHETAGEIVETGADVRSLSVGQRVVLDPNKSCGHCYFCRRHEYLNCQQISQLGIHRDGAFCEYVCWPERLVIAAPNDMAYSTLTLLEPLACVVRAAKKSRVSLGQSVVVLGAGPIGNLHVQLLHKLGVAPIFSFDQSPKRLSFAKEAGADFVANTKEELQSLVLEHTDGIGADVVIESIGQEALYQFATKVMRKGGHLALFGLTDPAARLDVPILDWILQENSAKGSVAGMAEDMHEALRLLRFGRIDATHFKHAQFVLDDIQSAFDTLADRPQDLKTQITIAAC